LRRRANKTVLSKGVWVWGLKFNLFLFSHFRCITIVIALKTGENHQVYYETGSSIFKDTNKTEYTVDAISIKYVFI
jgi:hypothetical protein